MFLNFVSLRHACKDSISPPQSAQRGRKFFARPPNPTLLRGGDSRLTRLLIIRDQGHVRLELLTVAFDCGRHLSFPFVRLERK